MNQTITILSHAGKFYRVVDCSGVEAFEETSLQAIGESAQLGCEIIIVPPSEKQADKLATLAHLLLHRARMDQELDDRRVEVTLLRATLASTMRERGVK